MNFKITKKQLALISKLLDKHSEKLEMKGKVKKAKETTNLADSFAAASLFDFADVHYDDKELLDYLGIDE